MDTAEFELHARIEDVHWWFKTRREIILDVLKRYIPANQGKIIAEIGCGTGGNLKYFKKYYQVIGSDISSEAVKHASKRVDCSIFIGDFRATLSPYWKDLHGVLLADVLEHIEDDRKFMEDIIYNLNRSGIILLTVPAHQFLWSNHDAALGHRRRYSAKSLHDLWKDLPVSEVFFSPFNSFLSPAIFLWRTFGALKSRNKEKSDLTLPPRGLNWILFKIFSLERRWLLLSPILIQVISDLCVLMKS